MTRQLLFLCTGNYYRSRYAELLFNHLAGGRDLAWRAFSRGLAIERGVDNVGPIAGSALAALAARGVAAPAGHRFPLAAAEADFARAAHIVALKRDEHLPLMRERFPAWTEKVEYWQVHDIDLAHPREALPEIEREVAGLLGRLALQTQP